MSQQQQVFVKPGPGVKVPLPIPGGLKVPASGLTVTQTSAVIRLIRTGDLVVSVAPENAPPVTKTTARPAPPAGPSATPAPAMAAKEK